MSSKIPRGWTKPNSHGNVHASKHQSVHASGGLDTPLGGPGFLGLPALYCSGTGSSGGDPNNQNPVVNELLEFSSWGSSSSLVSAPPGLDLPAATDEADRFLHVNELFQKQCVGSTSDGLEPENAWHALEHSLLKQHYLQASAVASVAAQASWNASYCANYGAYSPWGTPMPSPLSAWQQECSEERSSHQKRKPNANNGGGERSVGLSISFPEGECSPSGKTQEASTPLAFGAAPAPVFLNQALALANPLVMEQRESLGAARVSWTVDAKKLRGNDKILVSPQFGLPGRDAQAAFKMMIRPKIISDAKGGASFKKARGRGGVELKLEEGEASIVSFGLSVGGKSPTDTEKYVYASADQVDAHLGGGPIVSSHNFSESTLCKVEQVWDFVLKTDQTSQTFIVCLDVLPLGA